MKKLIVLTRSTKYEFLFDEISSGNDYSFLSQKGFIIDNKNCPIVDPSGDRVLNFYIDSIYPCDYQLLINYCIGNTYVGDISEVVSFIIFAYKNSIYEEVIEKAALEMIRDYCERNYL